MQGCVCHYNCQCWFFSSPPNQNSHWPWEMLPKMSICSIGSIWFKCNSSHCEEKGNTRALLPLSHSSIDWGSVQLVCGHGHVVVRHPGSVVTGPSDFVPHWHIFLRGFVRTQRDTYNVQMSSSVERNDNFVKRVLQVAETTSVQLLHSVAPRVRHLNKRFQRVQTLLQRETPVHSFL